MSSCEHLDRLQDVISKELWRPKEVAACVDCGWSGSFLWICLQGDCLHIGCSENSNDHSTKHYKENADHCVHMNLTTQRVWCYVCSREVHVRGMAAAAGGGGAGQRLLGLVRGPGLNVSYAPESGESSDEEDDDGKPRGLVGLRNIGNTCYMNSAVQALSNTPPLTQHFLDCGDVVDFLTDTKKPGLSKAYQKLVRDMWNKRTSAYVEPNGILYGIRNVQPMFRGYHQHDTQEFLRCFMDQLHEELKEPMREDRSGGSGGQAGGMISRQPGASSSQDEKKANSRLGETGSFDGGRRIYRNQRQSASSSDNIPMATNSNYYSRVHSQSESGVNGPSFLSGHRRSVSYCDYTQLPQDTHQGDSRCSSPVSGNRTYASGSSRTCDMTHEDDDEEEAYETCDSGVSDSASLSGEEAPAVSKGFKRKCSEGSRERGGGDQPPVPSSLPPSAQQRFRSVISDVFDGHLLSSVQCLTCNRISTRVETFQDLSLPIPSREHVAVLHGGAGPPVRPAPPPPQATAAACSDAVYSPHQGWIWWLLGWLRSWFYGPAVTLHDCLAAFFSADELKGDNMYSCEKCNKLRNGEKFSLVLGLPEVLCVHLKRFRHELMSSTKITAKVSFPLQDLDMRPFLHKDCVSSVSKYDLVAVICHAGTAGGGHYTCVARNWLLGRWFEFDDQYVTPVTPDQVAASEAYVLFYKKSNPRMEELRHKAQELLETSNELSDIKFYISKQWINRFNTYAEPGPIDNCDFICPHGGVSPERFPVVERLTTVISQTLWEFFYKNFGGGPACNHLHACSTCRAAAEKLRRRQHAELQRFTALHAQFESQECVPTMFAISMNWLRLWQAFARKKTQQPPPPIDNSNIILKPAQDTGSNKSSTGSSPPVIKPGSDHAQLNEDLWRFFHGIYGGGPEVRLKSAPSYQDRSSATSCPPNTNSISSGYESHSLDHVSVNSNTSQKQKVKDYTGSHHDSLPSNQSDGETNSSLDVPTTALKSLSNVDLFDYESYIKNYSVKETQSLQDVSVSVQSGSNKIRAVFPNDRQSRVHHKSGDAQTILVETSDGSIEYSTPKVHYVDLNNKHSNSTHSLKTNHNVDCHSGGGKHKGKGKRNRNSESMRSNNSSCDDSSMANEAMQQNCKEDFSMDTTSERLLNHKHYEDCNNLYANEGSMNNVSSSPKGKSVQNLDIHSMCSGMQAVSVDMPNSESFKGKEGNNQTAAIHSNQKVSKHGKKSANRKLKRQQSSGASRKTQGSVEAPLTNGERIAK